MNRLNFRAVILPVVAGLVIGWGCGEGKPSVDTSTAEATVKGTVTLNGKPATQGEVVFDPANYQRKDAAPRSAPIESDGSYSVTTLTGTNQVNVNSPELTDSDVAALEFDVQSGDNTFDIVLPSTQ